MKQQGKSSVGGRFSDSALRELQVAYQELARAIRRQPWLVQGSVNVVAAKSDSANVTYTWTRKVRAKTATVALSRQQAAAFAQAIKANRRVEAALARLRQLSHSALLAEIPGVTRRRLDTPRTTNAKNVPKGA